MTNRENNDYMKMKYDSLSWDNDIDKYGDNNILEDYLKNHADKDFRSIYDKTWNDFQNEFGNATASTKIPARIVGSFTHRDNGKYYLGEDELDIDDPESIGKLVIAKLAKDLLVED